MTAPDTTNQNPAAQLTRLLGTVPRVVRASELPASRMTAGPFCDGPVDTPNESDTIGMLEVE
jgi:hypothetical protein